MSKVDSFVSLKELRAEFPQYIAEVAKGRSFTVLKRSKPIFQITPVADEGEWITVADFRPEGIPADELLEVLDQSE